MANNSYNQYWNNTNFFHIITIGTILILIITILVIHIITNSILIHIITNSYIYYWNNTNNNEYWNNANGPGTIVIKRALRDNGDEIMNIVSGFGVQ